MVKWSDVEIRTYKKGDRRKQCWDVVTAER